MSSKTLKMRYMKKLAVYVAIVGLLLIFISYEIAIHRVHNIIEDIEGSINVEHMDSLLTTYKGKERALSDVGKLKERLFHAERIVSYVGGSENIVIKISKLQDSLYTTASMLQNYNEIQPSTFYNNKNKGLILKEGATYMSFFPLKSNNRKYFDIAFYFLDLTLPERITAIYIQIYQNNIDGNPRILWHRYYLPKNNFNVFKVPNLLKNKDVNVRVGYILNTKFENKNSLIYRFVTFDDVDSIAGVR